MFFYTISIIGSPLEPYTYQTSQSLDVGCVVFVTLNNREVKGIVLLEVKKPSFKTLEILKKDDFYFSSKQLKLAKFISSYYICSLGDAISLMLPYSLDAKEDKSILNYEKVDIKLSTQQTDVLEQLKKSKVSLLFGDTGSGKTEIYMKLFDEMIAKGKRSILLMPEISLTPQMGYRLQEHFGSKVVIWHSKLTPLAKKKAKQSIYDGSAYIIAGTRSALFTPIKNLGLIVVDEEHDDSYKSSSRPRYNAKDIAIYMGKLYDIPVVLGSATPSLSSYVKFDSVRLEGGYFKTNKEFV